MNTTSKHYLVVATALSVAAGTVRFNSDAPHSARAENVATETTPENRTIRFTDDGRLLQPTGYRRWTYVGTPLTPNDMNVGKAAFPEFHSVYINPQAYDQYQMTGKFPDGTVLVKELVSVGSKEATSGSGYFMGEFTGLEVLLKDKTRFKDEPGNWGFFSFVHEYPLKGAAAIQPTANYNDCHGGAADDDYVFHTVLPSSRSSKRQASWRLSGSDLTSDHDRYGCLHRGVHLPTMDANCPTAELFASLRTRFRNVQSSFGGVRKMHCR